MHLFALHAYALLLLVTRASALSLLSPDARASLKEEAVRVSPRNFVISCREDTKRLNRFRRHMQKADLDFEVFPCVEPSLADIKRAANEGILGPHAPEHFAQHSGFLGVALAHMRLLQNISASGAGANIFEDDEVVHDNYKDKRAQVLRTLPPDIEFINLNPLRPAGDLLQVSTKEFQIHKLHPGLPGNANVWLSNYYVSSAGATRVLHLMKGFDAGYSGPTEVDWKLAGAFTKGAPALDGGGFFSLTTNALSKHCQVASTKDRLNGQANLLSFDGDPVCQE